VFERKTKEQHMGKEKHVHVYDVIESETKRVMNAADSITVMQRTRAKCRCGSALSWGAWSKA
jgi:hypothetical protein